MSYKSIVGALVSVMMLTGAAMGQTTAMSASKPAVKITISKETTFLLGPLRPDGTVNYAAAINEMFSKDVTADNNAAVLIVKAVGPGAVWEKQRPAILKTLGLQDLPTKGDYLVGMEEFLKIESASTTSMPASNASESYAIWDVMNACATQPWSLDTQPMLAKWLKVNEKPIETLVQASKLPKFYYPIDSSDESPIMNMAFPPLRQIREGARMLADKAMLKFGQGDFAGAQSDLMTIHRLARLIEQNPTLIGELVAIAIDSLACGAEQNIAISGKLTAKQAMDFQTQLNTLPMLGKMPAAIDLVERAFMLDTIHLFAAGKPSANEILCIDPRLYNEWIGRADGDQMLRRINMMYDLIVTEAKSPFSAEGKAAKAQVQKLMDDARNDPTFKELLAKLAKSTDDSASTEKIIETINAFITSKSDNEVTELVYNYLVSMMTPSLDRAFELQTEAQMRMKLTRIAFALAAYKAENGKYPAELSLLVSTYITAVPKDIFTGGALVYKLQGNGYLMYSVGANQKDEGGKHEPITPAPKAGLPQFSDDIAVQAEK